MRWRRVGLELVIAAGVLIAIAVSGVGRTGPPADSEAAWLQRATPTLDRLATDLSVPGTGPLTGRQLRRLRSDAAAVRADGRPPQSVAARTWDQLLADVADAAAEGHGSPQQARAALEGAGLELSALTGS
jgi:hypothetical protein